MGKGIEKRRVIRKAAQVTAITGGAVALAAYRLGQGAPVQLASN